MKKELSMVLKYASLWGIAEASLGYILHAIALITGIRNISGFIMFPIGLFFMLLAYRETGKENSILYTGLFAGMIKLTDLFIPGLPKGATINPAMAIVLESGVIFGGIRYLKPRFAFHLPVLSSTWRIGFILLLSISPFSKGILSKGHMEILYFVFVEGIISGLLCVPVYRWINTQRKPRIKLNPELIPFVFVMAILAEFIFKIL